MTNCNASKCATTSWLMNAAIVFVFTMGFDWFVHGKLLMDVYEETANLWRTPEAMQALSMYCFAKHAVLALVFSALYACWRAKTTCGKAFSSECHYKKSAGFGLWIGLMLGVNAAASYIYMPIPAPLAVAWLDSEALKWSLAGVILSFFASRCNASATSAK